MTKQVSVLVGAGSIGQAIIRRVSAGKHVVLADYSLENAGRAAKTLEPYDPKVRPLQPLWVTGVLL